MKDQPTGQTNIDDENDDNFLVLQQYASKEERFGSTEDADLDDPMREDEPQDAGSTPSAEPFDNSTSTMHCLRTGLVFPSSKAMNDSSRIIRPFAYGTSILPNMPRRLT
jgi:hypothetical protein